MRTVTFGEQGEFAPTSGGIRLALEEGHRNLVFLEDIAWNESIVLDEFPGSFLSIFAHGGPMTTNIHRKFDGMCLRSNRPDLWRLHLSGVSFIDDSIECELPFLCFPRVDRSRFASVGFYQSKGPAFMLGESDGTGHLSETHFSHVEIHNCGGAFLLGMRNCTIDGRSSFERNTKPVRIIGDPDASGDSVIRDLNLEHDDGRTQLEVRHLTNSRIEDLRLVEASLAGEECEGTVPWNLNLHGDSNVIWKAPYWARRTWRRIPRNARGV